MLQVTVRSTGIPYTTRIMTSSHEWLADEPLESEGQDQAATPFQQFLGAIAACSVITAQMYARRKQWPLESVQIAISHERIDAADCPDCETRTGKISEFTLRVELEGDLTAEQRQRLLEIAGRCPVKRAIEGEAKFRLSSS
ncbi:MAG: OsmC family protein [Acidobacteriota bacterium]